MGETLLICDSSIVISCQVLRACEKALLWAETVYLYKEDGQHDAAVKTMVDHSGAFAQDLFLDCVVKV